MNILIVEDQEKIKEFLSEGLLQAGYHVLSTDSGREAEALCQKHKFELIVLDVGLPDQSGFDTARNLRIKGYLGSILMLTGFTSLNDKVKGLDAGADDYLLKPFEMDELLARVRALLRRPVMGYGVPTVLKFQDVEMDLIHRKVTRSGQNIGLTTKEFNLLEYFIRHADRPLSRAEITEKVWELKFDPESNVIDVYVNFLRKKLDAGFSSKLIRTVVGVGYVLKAEKTSQGVDQVPINSQGIQKTNSNLLSPN
jgi:two-component system copper resistance phosphate regulon response regulator CusR